MSNIGYYPICLHPVITMLNFSLSSSTLYPSYSFWLDYAVQGNDFHTFTDVHFTLVF